MQTRDANPHTEPPGLHHSSDSGADGTAARCGAAHRLEELRARTVRIEWADLHGMSRGKRMSSEHFLQGLDEGFAFSSAALWMNLRGDVVASEAECAEQEWPNVIARPLLRSLAPLPSEPQTAQVLADLYGPDGTPLAESPRQALKRVLDAMASRGYAVTIGLEFEFYLFQDDECQVLRPGKQVYRIRQGRAESRLLGEVGAVLGAMGLPIETSSPEDAPGQLEVTLPPGPALQVADAAFLVRNLIKEVASHQGMLATFLSKPLAGESGSGFHFHQSLTELETGRPAFYDGSHPYQLSATLRGYLAGQLAGLREASALYLPTVNAYKRTLSREQGRVTATWGIDNRTAALRVLGSSPASLRLENRVPAGEANPYLIIAAAVATGMAGMDAAGEPPPPATGNAYLWPGEDVALPANLRDALALLDRSAALRGALGDTLVDRFLALKSDEVRRFERAITDWERAEYLEFL